VYDSNNSIRDSIMGKRSLVLSAKLENEIEQQLSCGDSKAGEAIRMRQQEVENGSDH